MHWQITSLWGGKKVEIRETQRAVTPFGGLVVFFEFLQRVGYREAVREHLPFHLTSPNAIDPVETFRAVSADILHFRAATRPRIGGIVLVMQNKLDAG